MFPNWIAIATDLVQASTLNVLANDNLDDTSRLLVKFEFGDITQVPQIPSIVKSMVCSQHSIIDFGGVVLEVVYVQKSISLRPIRLVLE